MRRSLSSCLLFAVALSLGCTEPPKPEKAKNLDNVRKDDDKPKIELGPLPTGPIAVVNGVEIPNEAFTGIYNLKVQKYSERGREIPATADRRYRKSIAERLIWNEVLQQEAKKLEVDYDPDELSKREAQQRRGIRDWDKHLQRRGETEESLKAMYVAELREKAILEKQGALEVSADEVQADYDKIKGNWSADKPRVRASHILVPVGPKQTRRGGDAKADVSEEDKKKQEEQAKTKIDELYTLATAEGADFAEIAREHSTGPSANKGGDIGIFTEDRMAEEFSETAFGMEVDQISKPVKTKFGWHIIKVTGKWPPGDLPLAALEDQIRDRLKQRKLHQGRRKLKEDLLGKYEITDNVKPTLGPEPQRRKPRRPKKGEKPHNPVRERALDAKQENGAHRVARPEAKAKKEG